MFTLHISVVGNGSNHSFSDVESAIAYCDGLSSDPYAEAYITDSEGNLVQYVVKATEFWPD